MQDQSEIEACRGHGSICRKGFLCPLPDVEGERERNLGISGCAFLPECQALPLQKGQQQPRLQRCRPQLQLHLILI